MRVRNLLCILAIVLSLLLNPVSAEGTNIVCAVFNNGYLLEQFVSSPSVDTLWEYSKTFTVTYNDSSEYRSEPAVYAYETQLVRWLYDHDSEFSPQNELSGMDSMQFDVSLIIPGVLPSFLWIRTQTGDNYFVSCPFSTLKKDLMKENIAVYPSEMLRDYLEECHCQIDIRMDGEIEFCVDGIQYPWTTMVPLSAMIEQRGGTFEETQTDAQFSIRYQGIDHTLLVKDNQISCIDGEQLEQLKNLQLGGKSFLWTDDKGELWMDIDAALRLIRYFEE